MRAPEGSLAADGSSNNHEDNRAHPVDAKLRTASHGPTMSVVVARDIATLADHMPAWEGLVEAALEPNVFYEPWMLLPAFQAFGHSYDLRFVLVFRPDPSRPSGPPSLCGIFPLERIKRFKGLPVTLLRLWRHKYCFLCTPLLHRRFARETLAAFLDWLRTDPDGAPLLEWPLVPGQGEFSHVLTDVLREKDILPLVSSYYTRAFLQVRQDGEAYLQASVKGHHRRKMKRLERMLGERGSVNYAALEPQGNVEQWLKAFLDMEAASWKGRTGSALSTHREDEAFFLTVAREAFRRNRLMMFALHLSGRPIAFNCYLQAAPGCFYFKPAFNEEFAPFSPGRLLEVETIHRLHAQPGIEWVDSCTATDNELLNSLWMERRTMMAVYVSSGRAPGDFVVSLLPMLRWLKRALRAGPNKLPLDLRSGGHGANR